MELRFSVALIYDQIWPSIFRGNWHHTLLFSFYGQQNNFRIIMEIYLQKLYDLSPPTVEYAMYVKYKEVYFAVLGSHERTDVHRLITRRTDENKLIGFNDE